MNALLERIAAQAAALDADPRFPTEAMSELAQLPTPPSHREEWALVRQVAKADGSVGRIFEGHLNAKERLQLDGIDPEDHWLGVWGADPLPHEGEPAAITGDTLTGTKVFCSGAGGLTRALVIAKGTLVYVDLTTDTEVDRTWYRASGMRASESHRVHFHGTPILATLTPLITQPYLAGDAIRTAAAWAGIVDAAVDSALEHIKPDDELRALAAGRMVVAQQTIDRWFEYAATSADLTRVSIPLRAAVAEAGATVFAEAARATGSRPFATGTPLERARRDFELFVHQHRLDPFVARLGAERIRGASAREL